MDQTALNPKEPLTGLQRRYVWLAGSHPSLIVTQGRGYRGLPTYYAIDNDTLYLFGYSNPLYFLSKRGIFRKLQDPKFYTLTEKGESIYSRMLISGAGIQIDQEIAEAKLAGK